VGLGKRHDAEGRGQEVETGEVHAGILHVGAHVRLKGLGG
jgi:hypothetical protein